MSVPSDRILRGGESEIMQEDEQEDMRRRKRRVRFSTEEFSGDQTMKPRDEAWMQAEGKEPATTPKSYRESLLQNVNARKCWWEWASIDDEDEAEGYGADMDFSKVLNPGDGISVDQSNPLCPKFLLEEKERERLMKPFRRTLMVKLMGRQPSYGFMVKNLRQIWERKGNIDIFDLDNDFYLVSFQHNEDYMEALIGGPWVINDAYLSVARWRPDFNPKNARIESVVAWVRIPELPAPLFDKKFLLNLGNSIGKAIRLDIHTAQRSRGKFARMCVELDLTKPLVPAFNVDGQILSVVYESVGLLCTKCGWYGHNKNGCDNFHRKKYEDMVVEEKGEQIKDGIEREGETEIWKTVQRPRRQRSNVMPIVGSRFSVLHSVVGEDEERPKVANMKENDRAAVSFGKGLGDGVRKSILEAYKVDKVNMEEKENLHPGERMEGIDMSPTRQGSTNAGGELLKNMESSMVEGGVASKGIANVLRDIKCRYKVDLVVVMETRISGNHAAKVIKSWGFKHSVRMEADGFSGGIWLLWEWDELIVDVLVKDEQFVHCRVSMEGKEMLFTAVYANPCEQRRHRTWEVLHMLASDVAEPWLMAGDFNEIKTPLEQKGGGRINETRCRNFNEWIQSCNLIDVEANGPYFTWRGPKWKRAGHSL
ncbi:hypothetical protein K1719_042303 [Acacia pycnantha]|nr:hypothetical protein K1719_042303 [Acacia pycnantha]